MNPLRRLSLVFLLILLLIGFSAHLLTAASGTQHALSEATCAVHQGVNLPASFPSSWREPWISPEPTHGDARALDVVVKIHHPPTL